METLRLQNVPDPGGLTANRTLWTKVVVQRRDNLCRDPGGHFVGSGLMPHNGLWHYVGKISEKFL